MRTLGFIVVAVGLILLGYYMPDNLAGCVVLVLIGAGIMCKRR